jgi:hypothetical protein
MTPTGFRLGEFVVEPATDRLLHVDTGTRTDLEPKTMEVLVVLADHTGEVVSSATLINCVWHGRPMGDNPVYKAVAKLRRPCTTTRPHRATSRRFHARAIGCSSRRRLSPCTIRGRVQRNRRAHRRPLQKRPPPADCTRHCNQRPGRSQPTAGVRCSRSPC